MRKLDVSTKDTTLEPVLVQRCETQAKRIGHTLKRVSQSAKPKMAEMQAVLLAVPVSRSAGVEVLV